MREKLDRAGFEDFKRNNDFLVERKQRQEEEEDDDRVDEEELICFKLTRVFRNNSRVPITKDNYEKLQIVPPRMGTRKVKTKRKTDRNSFILHIIHAIATLNLLLLLNVNAQQSSPASIDILPSATDNANGEQTSSAATCFGGLQTFEKISMSSFENPAGFSGSPNPNSFGSGILVQQDDQALTSECVNLCRSQSNCLSFVIDYNKFECKSYATTQQELQQEFDAKYQAARSVNSNNSTNSTSDTYSASSSLNFQHLLPSSSSNYFEKICLDGVANKNQFSDLCGQDRLWTIERVVDTFLDGYVEKEVTNVNNKDECSKLCIFEAQFVCRSADYDQQSRLCRLSKEDRRTQPQAMRYVPNSNKQYIENQCATPSPSSCVYETKRNLAIISMDALKFAQTVQDCQMKCNQEVTFNCRSYSFHQQRCFLSGDDSASLNSNSIKLPVKQGWQFGEKKCLVELCTKGIFSYEKITGYALRSALSTPIDLMMAAGSNIDEIDRMQQHQQDDGKFRHLLPFLGAIQSSSSSSNTRKQSINGSSTSEVVSTMMRVASNGQEQFDLMAESSSYNNREQRKRSSSNLAITNHCRHSCDLGYLNCPAFTIDYKNNRCQRLDRNSQGRHNELVARDGFSYYEKICLRVPEIMTMCQDKYWIFERVIGYELAPRFYDKTLKFVQSRRDCEEYCLEEKQFECRSALYNDESSDCKLSRYDRRLATLEGGYYKNFNSRISYLENQCIRDHQATTSPTTTTELVENKKPREQLQCYYEQAREEPAYPTFTEHIEMVPPQASVVNMPSELKEEPYNFQKSQNMTNNLSNKIGSSFCEQLCNDNIKFECHSFGYYASTAQCFLSGDDSISAGDMTATPSTGFTYFEKKCRFANNFSSGLPSANNSEEEMSTNQPMPQPMNPYFNSMNNSTTEKNNEKKNIPMTPSNQPSNMDAVHHKCGPDHSFVYQRVSGFEPIGGYLTVLIKSNQQPGIVGECSELCRKAFECRAFVVDYNSNQCYAMLENSAIGTLSLRQTLGKDYFEGFCVPDYSLLSGQTGSCKNKTWIMDKIVDQAVVGVEPQKVLMDVDRVQCRQACLEERLFYCKSAMFDATNANCKLYSVDRESIAQMRLHFTKEVDFFENQCQIVTNTCPYDPIERDLSSISVTKSIQARSTYDCEHACNIEQTFNCRSYSYLEQNPQSLPNMCLLSSDSRLTSQKGSIRERSRTLYAERNCFFRRPRFPQAHHPDLESPPEPLFEPPTSVNKLPQYPMPANDPYKPPRTSIGHQSQISSQNSHQSDVYGHHLSVDNMVEKIHSNSIPGAACEPHQYTFERVFGYDYRLGTKERASIAPTIGIAIGCQQECLRRGDRCQSFVVEYGLPYQSCFLIETQVGANKKLLVKSLESAYFEKVCLPRTGVSLDSTSHPPTNSEYSHQHVSYAPALTLADSSFPPNMDITPSYSSEPWTPNHQTGSSTGSVLPYYLQQEQLLQNYPSRSCAKLWTFERFLNHNFSIQADKQAENILTRAQCEILCLNEASFNCRSATYDYTNKLCRLFKNTRRTIMSHFVDLTNPSAITTSTSSSQGGASSPSSGPSGVTMGTAQVINNGAESMHEASSNNRLQATARQLTNEPPNESINIDYLENTCTPEPSSCQYRQLYDLFNPFIDKINHAVSLSDCQRQCDLERLFGCKSINYDPSSRNCMLISEDLISLNRGGSSLNSPSSSSISYAGLIPKKNTIYSEKGNCEMISVQCNSQEMLVSINFDSAFRGRVMAKGNPDQCFKIGDGQTSLQFPILFGPKCNTRQEGHNTFVNELVIQQHPVIMTDSDKTVRIMCAFEAPEQTITLKNPTSRDNKTVGIDVGAPETSRTRHDKQQFNSIVSNKAAPPSVLLRILDQNNRDASMINLGDDLTLKIQMQLDSNGQQTGSALGIFARNLAAKSSNGESLLLIDNDGCPVDHQVFPGLEIDPKDGKSLLSNFKAFRFPSSGLVNFEVQIRFCPEQCQPVNCNLKQGGIPANQQAPLRAKSYGKRRKKRQVAKAQTTSVLESVETPNPLDALSTVMKPGKAFQFVRELMLNKPMEQQDLTKSIQVSNEVTPLPPQQENSQPELSNAPESSEPINTSGETASTEASLTEINQDFESKSENQPAEGQQKDITIYNSDQMTNNENQAQLSNSNQSPSILMHIDEKVLKGHTTQYHSPPYGRFPTAPDNFKPPQTMQPQFQPVLESTRPNSMESVTNSADSLEPTMPPVEEEQEEEAPDQNNQPVMRPSSGDKDMPLKFSILVGENQPQTNIKDNNNNNSPWNPIQPVGALPPVLVMNSSKLDLDHIVVPGKDGQLSGSSIQQDSTQGSGFQTIINNNNLGESQLTNESNKVSSTSRNSVYEQTFDALPSNSVVAEVKMHNTRQAFLSNNEPTVNTKIIAGNKISSDQGVASERTGSHDCAGTHSTAGGRLWTVIWTGAIVIALNICLVLLSLVLYFRKVHWFKRNNTILRTTTSDFGTHSSLSDADGTNGRWPSVLSKRKSNLPTSLNTHEHFFYKLNTSSSSSSGSGSSSNNCNTKPTNAILSLRQQPTTAAIADFNWPNLSSSSTHSTISSLATADHLQSTSTSIIRINQSSAPTARLNNIKQQQRQQLYKPNFTDSSSIRNGKFNTAIYEPDNNFNTCKSNSVDLNSCDVIPQESSSSSSSSSAASCGCQ